MAVLTQEYPSFSTLFEIQVKTNPDAIALIFENQHTSYSELDKRSNQLARYLINCGVGADRIVPILLHRSTELFISILAVLKAGGAYLPLDPVYPAERLAFMLEDSGASFIIAHDFSEWLPNNLTVINPCDFKIKESVESFSDAPILNRERLSPIRQDHLAYLIYTSGSTGKAKGTAITHQALNTFLNSISASISINKTDTLLAVTTIAFDIAALEVYLPFIHGARTVLANMHEQKDPFQLAQLIDQYKVSIVQATPSLWIMLSSHLNLPDIKILVGGEGLPQSLAAKILPAQSITNLYGPTEATIWASAYSVKAEDTDTRLAPNIVPIGKPLIDYSMYILDGFFDEVADGEVGELFISGSALARGYLNRSGLTAERFIANPFIPGTRMYRTGDLVRRRTDGNLEFIGRIDEQVKIRGFRIELGEIEAALLQGLGQSVSQVAVIARERVSTQSTQGTRDQHLVAYLVARADNAAELPGDDQIRSVLSRTLPEYMVPAAFVRLDSLPLTPNGKLDRKALPDPDFSASQSTYRAPVSEHEILLCGLFAEVTGTSRVGLDDSFFAIGGDSISAMRLVAKINKQNRSALTLRDLFKQQTPVALALTLNESVDVHFHASVAQVPRNPDGQVNLSYGQNRLWFLEQIDGATATYNMPIAYRLRGKLNVDALKNALLSVIERHESLRTLLIKNETYQAAGVICPVPNIDYFLRTIHLDHIKDRERETDLAQLIKHESSQAFNLAQDIPIRAQLICLDKNEHVLSLTIHHHASDGLSLTILTRELSIAYAAYYEGSPPNFVPLPIQYSDWAAWQQEYFQNHTNSEQSLAAKISRAKMRLTGFPDLLTLKTDYPRKANRNKSAGNCVFKLSSDLTTKLIGLAEIARVTLYTVIMTAYGTLLTSLANQRQVLIGSPVAGRMHHDTEGLIGFFVNTVVIPFTLDPTRNVLDTIAQVNDFVQETIADQDLPFERVVEELEVSRSLSHHPLFQVMLSYQNVNVDDARLTLTGLQVEDIYIASTQSKFDLNLFIGLDDAGVLAGGFEYDSGLFSEQSVQRWITAFTHLLEGLAVNPLQVVGNLSLLNTTQKKKNLSISEGREFHQKVIDHDTLPDTFNERVRKNPQSIALHYEGFELTYEELDKRSNRLARYLISHGVKPDSVVAIALNRSNELIISMLAVLKAGGAYLSLDPSHPISRQQFMLSDSNVCLLLTNFALSEILQENIASLSNENNSLHVWMMENQTDLDEYSDEVIAQSDRNAALYSDHLAYVIYTSGSTGQPKAVGNTHRNVVRLLKITDAQFGFNENDIWSFLHSSAFDFSVWEIWGALGYGGALVIAPESVRRSPPELTAFLVQHGVTVLNQTPGAFEVLSQHLIEHRHLAKELSLRYVIFGGAALNPNKLAHWWDVFPAMPRLINMYGITETTVHVTYYPLDPTDADSDRSIVGTAIPDLATYILNTNLELVSEGVVGEIYVAGPGLARGYLNRSGLTAERFIASPFEPGTCMYRTGDLGRWHDDGNIEFIGRMDEQVKIRGYRIELGEIESTLLQELGESLHQVAVIPQERSTAKNSNDTYLVAYIVERTDTESSQSNSNGSVPPFLNDVQIKTLLARRLPEYMVPSLFVRLPSLPLTVNGKIDRKALPVPQLSENTSPYHEPITDLEILLCSLFSEVIGVSRVSLEDNFFEIGGHSLLAMRLIARVQQLTLYELPLRTLFESPTVRALAQVIQEQKQLAYRPLLPLRKTGDRPPLFCIHPGGGSGTVYKILTDALAIEQPVWALQARGIEAHETYHDTLDQMVKDYVAALKEVQSTGPYNILGYSFGGIVAHEMACLLERQGEFVSSLILLDVQTIFAKFDNKKDVEQQLLKNLANDLCLDPEICSVDNDLFLAKVKDHLVNVGMAPESTPIDMIKRMLTQSINCQVLTSGHQIQKCQAPILLIRANEDLAPSDPAAFDWTQYTSSAVEIASVQAKHTDMLWRSSSVPILTKEIERYLAKNKFN